MKEYIVGQIFPDKDGCLKVVQKNGKTIPVLIPDCYLNVLRPGMTISVHTNRVGRDVAYSFDGYMFFVIRPMTPVAIESFLGNFKNIYDYSLDSIHFKQALRCAVHKMGGVPSAWNVLKNMIKYNECMQNSKFR